MSKFMELRLINVNKHTEKKAGLTYLSWAWAVDQLLHNDPMATWSYGDPVKFGESLMVFCTVEAFGKKMTAQLPVMDHRNKAISKPDAFQVNVAMQRCLAKAIALHGIGLYIYAGEDIPSEDIDLQNVANTVMDFKDDVKGAVDYLESKSLDKDQKVLLMALLSPETIKKIKAEAASRKSTTKEQ